MSGIVHSEAQIESSFLQLLLSEDGASQLVELTSHSAVVRILEEYCWTSSFEIRPHEDYIIGWLLHHSNLFLGYELLLVVLHHLFDMCQFDFSLSFHLGLFMLGDDDACIRFIGHFHELLQGGQSTLFDFHCVVAFFALAWRRSQTSYFSEHSFWGTFTDVRSASVRRAGW